MELEVQTKWADQKEYLVKIVMVTGGGNNESRCVCVDTRGTEMSDGCNKVSIENSQDLSSQNFFGKKLLQLF